MLCVIDDGGDGDNWSYKTCKAPVKSSPPTNQHPVFTGWMSFRSPNQQCQSTEGKNNELKTDVIFVVTVQHNVLGVDMHLVAPDVSILLLIHFQ